MFPEALQNRFSASTEQCTSGREVNDKYVSSRGHGLNPDQSLRLQVHSRLVPSDLMLFPHFPYGKYSITDRECSQDNYPDPENLTGYFIKEMHHYRPTHPPCDLSVVPSDLMLTSLMGYNQSLIQNSLK